MQTNKDIIVKFLIKKIFDSVFLKYPLLVTGPQGWVLNWILTKVINELLLDGQILIIHFEKHGDRIKYDQARDNFDNLQGKGTQDEIDKAEQALIDSFRNHVKFN